MSVHFSYIIELGIYFLWFFYWLIYLWMFSHFFGIKSQRKITMNCSLKTARGKLRYFFIKTLYIVKILFNLFWKIVISVLRSYLKKFRFICLFFDHYGKYFFYFVKSYSYHSKFSIYCFFPILFFIFQATNFKILNYLATFLCIKWK